MLKRGFFKKGCRRKTKDRGAMKGDSTDKSTDASKAQDAATTVPEKRFQPFRLLKKKDKSKLENGDPNSERTDMTLSDSRFKGDQKMVSTDETACSEMSKGLPESLAQEEDAEDPTVLKSYDTVPLLEISKLPRGGVSMETQAVGRVQFGIPPETIKDSMRLGLGVPTVYIVPVERFCREMGPGLGVNLAEFEFPAYFNFFVLRKKCTLIVDSDDAEQNIRRVFSETLLGPEQFRRAENGLTYEEEDFAPDFPREAIPNFQKELKHFRIMPDGKELVLETLIKFCHFSSPGESGVHDNLGIPPPLVVDDYEGETGPSVENDLRENQPAEEFEEGVMVPNDANAIENHEKKRRWTYSHASFDGDVATVYPSDATPEQIAARSLKRVEIFKMPGGTEYIVHDIDENNVIVGKARFSGHVRVSEKMSVAGFRSARTLAEQEAKDEGQGDHKDDDSIDACDSLLNKGPPTFHPPSFGVTVLGNSHGFDKSGSVSGYVLWINGRGVMIDPPPYSSATLEREGIRPRTIVGIILTHCHADHDAGAFQKVLTGSQVVVITTPTIYKSFIRKYAALSNLSPVLLRHSHRYKAAIIGTPLRFQGATFHFTYSLHTIPCVGFRVEWRGRSLVFTGDHFNSPPAIEKLQETGVLSKARADDLRHLPLQETDLLLHEAGAPPIHTPLDVLLKLPNRVKKRMYVVHTSALPEGCELRVAPTGTAGTIRLDQVQKSNVASSVSSVGFETSFYVRPRSNSSSLEFEDDGLLPSPWNSSNEYDMISEEVAEAGRDEMVSTSFRHIGGGSTGRTHRFSMMTDQTPPLVSLRPASSTDAWFVLNLLSSVPFLTSLSYASTMEVLETARVDAFCLDDVVVPSNMRRQVLCVIWEGTCVERRKSNSGSYDSNKKRSSTVVLSAIMEAKQKTDFGTGAVWHAGDWTGPISLQPEKGLSGESDLSATHDVVAMSSEGVKVITIEISSLHAILKSGSPLYRKYLERRSTRPLLMAQVNDNPASGPVLGESTKKEILDGNLQNMSVLELLNTNYTFRKLSAVQKRHLESLAEGPVNYGPSERLWRSGAPVEKAFIIVAGTVSFAPRRRNAGSVSWRNVTECTRENEGRSRSVGESMRIDAIKAIKELGASDTKPADASSGVSPRGNTVIVKGEDHQPIELDTVFGRRKSTEFDIEEDSTSMTDAHDYEKLSRGLQKRADLLSKPKRPSASTGSIDSLHYDESLHDDDSQVDLDVVGISCDTESSDSRGSLRRRRSSRARHANKVLGRLYSRRAFTGGLVFSRGHFLGDVSKMVAGLLSTDGANAFNDDSDDGNFPKFGFGDDAEGGNASDPTDWGSSIGDLVIHEQEGGETVVHSSTLTAGKDGCVVLVFQKSSLIPFLDEYPGLLLSLLGTQVVV